MSEEQEKKKPKKRRTATKAAASIGPMVKALIGDTLKAKEEGKGYTEYLRALFQAYLSSTKKEIVDSIAAERRDWIQGKIASDYSHRDLMELGRLTYNNLVEDGTWETNSKPKETKTKEQNFLALATELVKTLAKTGEVGNTTGGKRKDGDTNKDKWRDENPRTSRRR